MPASTVDEKIDAVARELQSLVSEVSKDESSRKKLLRVIQQALAGVEAPVESIWRMIMSVSTDGCSPMLIRIWIGDN
jgi:hypothetical protein